MAKKYVNGYDRFRIVTKLTGTGDKVYDFSFKYEALKEYYERVSVMITLIGGSKRKKSRYIDYEWRLFYTNYIEAADLVKLKNIENDEINGREIWLTPHIDIEGRYFRVFILDEKREIDLHYHQRGNDETANKGFEISFVNADAILEVNMVDPNEYVAGVGGSSETGFGSGGIQGQVD